MNLQFDGFAKLRRIKLPLVFVEETEDLKSAVLPAIPNSMLKFVLSEAIFDPFWRDTFFPENLYTNLYL